MGKTVQIRNMPQETHEILEARAAQAGLSLSDYLLRELKKAAERPTKDELIERMRMRTRFDVDTAEAVRQGREERDAQMDESLKDVHR